MPGRREQETENPKKTGRRYLIYFCIVSIYV